MRPQRRDGVRKDDKATASTASIIWAMLLATLIAGCKERFDNALTKINPPKPNYERITAVIRSQWSAKASGTQPGWGWQACHILTFSSSNKTRSLDVCLAKKNDRKLPFLGTRNQELLRHLIPYFWTNEQPKWRFPHWPPPPPPLSPINTTLTLWQIFYGKWRLLICLYLCVWVFFVRLLCDGSTDVMIKILLQKNTELQIAVLLVVCLWYPTVSMMIGLLIIFLLT